MGTAASGDPGAGNADPLQLQELQVDEDDPRRMPPAVTLTLLVVGGACVVFAALALGGRTSRSGAPPHDNPFGELALRRAAATAAAAPRPTDLSPKDVTFPQMLSDDGPPTTALAAVRAVARPAASASGPVAAQPTPATARPPAVPLPPLSAPVPAQSLLEATPIVTHPRDPLARAASDAAQVTTPAAPRGHDGGYQLQVSSFHSQPEADAFAEQLRARGHKAYVVEARVPGRGTWYRVRIGPFQTQRLAAQYRAAFEEREHVVPFVVPPDMTPKSH
ncbi:MAG: SPOR domain-containing protein [Polyangiaceae bacterium]|nr:SPOR domain-containing protein [Polyangiaceae bacterium]